MSDTQTEINPLKAAYLAALEAQGRAAADLLVSANGGSAGPHGWRHVPPAKVDAAIAALNALATGHKSDTAATVSGLDRIRKQAFAKMGSSQPVPATPPTTLNHAEIMARWNTPVGRTLGDKN